MSSSGSPSRTRPGWFVWVVALTAVVPAALVFWAWRLPSAAARDSIFLAGQWRGTELTDGGVETLLAADVENWKPVKVPGSFRAQGLSGEVVLRRSVELPPRLHGTDLLLIVGYVRNATMRVFVNGTPVGVRGLYGKPFIGSESQLAVMFVPHQLIREGPNDVAFQVFSNERERDGLTDSRIILGRQDALADWAFHELMVRGAIELGALLLIAFLFIVVAVLWSQLGAKAPRRLYGSTLGMLVASSLYLLGKSGFLVTAVLPSNAVMRVVVLGIHCLGLVVPEFVEAYYLGRSTLFGKLNRVVSGSFLVVFVVAISLGREPPFTYTLYINWLFLLLAYALVIAVRDGVLGVTRFGPVASVAIVLTVGAGVNDLLGDLDIIFSPRLFTLAVSNLGIASAIVVIGEFLQLADENRALSTTLTLRNDELAVALTKAQDSARVKSEFLANTSHELRTPLNAIINIPQGLLELIDLDARVRCRSCKATFELDEGERFDAAAPCPDCAAVTLERAPGWRSPLDAAEAAKLLGSVVSSGTHLLAVVNDILDYSKLEAGRMTLHREAVEVSALLEGVRSSLEPVAKKSGVSLDVAAVPAGERWDLDRVKVMQVLINLVSNAIKFSDGKGTVHVSAQVSGDRLRVSVRDHGIGIAPEHHATIFEGFRQVESGHTRRFGGTGLGLAISRRLVEAHGGALTLSSAVGQGSTFTVELPRRAQPPPEEPSGKRTVLLVDDEVSALDATVAALRPLGLSIVSVRDPREALEKARASRPELIILDVMMPRVSGLELLRDLKADPALRDVPVVVSSAFPDNQRAAEVLGAVFVAKPWLPGDLLRVVETLLGPRRPDSPAASVRSPS